MNDADHAAKGVERDLSAHFAADERDQLKELLDRAIATLQDRTNRPEPRLARYPTQVLRPGDTHPATRLARPTRGGHPGTPHDQLSRPDEYGPLD